MAINKEKLLLNAPKERYEQQLNDTRWKLKANNIRKRDNHECQVCGAKKKQLDVHHIRYVSGREAKQAIKGHVRGFKGIHRNILPFCLPLLSG